MVQIGLETAHVSSADSATLAWVKWSVHGGSHLVVDGSVFLVHLGKLQTDVVLVKFGELATYAVGELILHVLSWGLTVSALRPLVVRDPIIKIIDHIPRFRTLVHHHFITGSLLINILLELLGGVQHYHVRKVHTQFHDELHILVVIETVNEDVEAICIHSEIRPNIVVSNYDSLLGKSEHIDFESLLLYIKLHTLKKSSKILG